MSELILQAHIGSGALLVLFILIQDKGAGLSATFGGGGGFYASQRGAAKVIHQLTVFFAFCFFATALFYVVAPALFA